MTGVYYCAVAPPMHPFFPSFSYINVVLPQFPFLHPSFSLEIATCMYVIITISIENLNNILIDNLCIILFSFSWGLLVSNICCTKGSPVRTVFVTRAVEVSTQRDGPISTRIR